MLLNYTSTPYTNKDDIITLPSEVSVEIVPELFFTNVGSCDKDTQDPHHYYFSVSDIPNIKK